MTICSFQQSSYKLTASYQHSFFFSLYISNRSFRVQYLIWDLTFWLLLDTIHPNWNFTIHTPLIFGFFEKASCEKSLWHFMIHPMRTVLPQFTQSYVCEECRTWSLWGCEVARIFPTYPRQRAERYGIFRCLRAFLNRLNCLAWERIRF